jgi:hypothetical protein
MYPLPNSRQIVREILTEDRIYRNAKHWPLVPLSDFRHFRNTTDSSETLRDADLFMAPDYHHSWVRNINPEEDGYIKYMNSLESKAENFHEIFYEKFPHIQPLLEKYKGKLAVCGGIITRILTEQSVSNHDVDLFFYNTTKDEAFVILLDCVATLVSNYNGKAVIERKLYVTNVVLEGEDEDEDTEIWTYQFIHRIYPTLDSIIGGFDLGCSALTFDGEEVYGTPLGAFSIAKRCLIVDTARRSLSFEQRILKYHRMGFAIIFPGITIGKAEESMVVPKELYPSAHKVYMLMERLGLRFVDHSGHINSYDGVLELTSKDIYLEKVKIDINNSIHPVRRNLTNFETTPEDVLRKFTDYGGLKEYQWKHKANVNGNVLRANNIEAVSVFVTFGVNDDGETEDELEDGLEENMNDQSYDAVASTFLNLISDPQFQIDEKYKGKAFAYIAIKQKKIDNRDYYNVNRIRPEVKLFAEMAPRMRVLQFSLPTHAKLSIKDAEKRDNIIQEMELIVNLLYDRMIVNAIKAKESLTGIKWIDQDPGRQWTSSINPIVRNPKDFYGEYYIPFPLGIPCDVETTLRLIRKKAKGTSLSTLPGDLFKLILFYVLRAYTYNTPKNLPVKHRFSVDQFLVIAPVQTDSRPPKDGIVDYFATLAKKNGEELPKRKMTKAERLELERKQQGSFMAQLMAPPQTLQQPIIGQIEDRILPTGVRRVNGYNIVIVPIPMPISQNELPKQVLILNDSLRLDQLTGIVYKEWPQGWTTYGCLEK